MCNKIAVIIPIFYLISIKKYPAIDIPIIPAIEYLTLAVM